jgi:hypothetical protein
MLDTLCSELYVLAKDYAIYLIMLFARNIFRQTTPASVHN